MAPTRGERFTASLEWDSPALSPQATSRESDAQRSGWFPASNDVASREPASDKNAALAGRLHALMYRSLSLQSKKRLLRGIRRFSISMSRQLGLLRKHDITLDSLFLSHQAANLVELDRVAKAFITVDRDRSGQLCEEDIMEALELCDLVPAREVVSKIFKEIGGDLTGTITAKEFLSFVHELIETEQQVTKNGTWQKLLLYFRLLVSLHVFVALWLGVELIVAARDPDTRHGELEQGFGQSSGHQKLTLQDLQVAMLVVAIPLPISLGIGCCQPLAIALCNARARRRAATGELLAQVKAEREQAAEILARMQGTSQWAQQVRSGKSPSLQSSSPRSESKLPPHPSPRLKRAGTARSVKKLAKKAKASSFLLRFFGLDRGRRKSARQQSGIFEAADGLEAGKKVQRSSPTGRKKSSIMKAAELEYTDVEDIAPSCFVATGEGELQYDPSLYSEANWLAQSRGFSTASGFSTPRIDVRLRQTY